MKLKLTTLVLSAMLAVPAIAQEHTLVLASVGAPEAPESIGIKKMVEYITETSDGRIVIQPQLSGALGGDREMIEGVQLGTIDIALVGTAIIGNFDPAVQIFDIPFLFKDLDHASRVLSGPIGSKFMEGFEEHGFIGLSFGGLGFRELTNSVRPVKTLDDLKGLKLRTMETPIDMEAWQMLGALPTPMSITEVYTALQQGVVDGQENPINAILGNKFDEVQKHISMTNHKYTPVSLIIAPSTFSGLSADDQKIVTDGAKLMMKVTEDEVRKVSENGAEILEANGLTVTYDVEIESFQEALKPLYAKLGERFGQEQIDEIINY